MEGHWIYYANNMSFLRTLGEAFACVAKGILIFKHAEFFNQVCDAQVEQGEEDMKIKIYDVALARWYII